MNRRDLLHVSLLGVLAALLPRRVRSVSVPSWEDIQRDTKYTVTPYKTGERVTGEYGGHTYHIDLLPENLINYPKPHTALAG